MMRNAIWKILVLPAMILTAACDRQGEIIKDPEWMRVSDSADGAAIYVDRASRNGPHDAKSVWVFYRQSYGMGHREQIYFNCSKATMAATIDDFEKGKVAGVDPGSILASVFNYACFDRFDEGYGARMLDEPLPAADTSMDAATDAAAVIPAHKPEELSGSRGEGIASVADEAMGRDLFAEIEKQKPWEKYEPDPASPVKGGWGKDPIVEPAE